MPSIIVLFISEYDDIYDVCEDSSIDIDGLLSEIQQERGWEGEPRFDELDDNEESEDSEDETGYENTPIYPGHSLSVSLSVFLIWIFIRKHSLTGVQISDLLQLINIHLLVPHPVLSSFYKLRKIMKPLINPIKKHFFCTFCYASVSQGDKICKNPFCLKDLTPKNCMNYFLKIPIIQQIHSLFQNESFRNNISHKFKRIKKNPNNIEDIYDSTVYKHLSANNGPLSNSFPHNLSFTASTDGVPIFKSSHISIWPIFLVINELPYKERKLRKNMLLCGVWIGKGKPFMQLFCNHLHESLLSLEKGIDIALPNDHIISCKAFLLCFTADLPAKSGVLNMNQFNGEYSCIKCLQKGQNHRTENKGNIRVFPYEDLVDRTHESIINNAHTALSIKQTTNGIKGPSFLMFCPYFDIVQPKIICMKYY